MCIDVKQQTKQQTMQYGWHRQVEVGIQHRMAPPPQQSPNGPVGALWALQEQPDQQRQLCCELDTYAHLAQAGCYHHRCLQAPTHFLVIPKDRDGLTRLSKADERHKALLGHLMYVAQLVAKQGEHTIAFVSHWLVLNLHLSKLRAGQPAGCRFGFCEARTAAMGVERLLALCMS
jgi:hypothetical protein